MASDYVVSPWEYGKYALSLLPLSHATRNDAEKRMRLRQLDVLELTANFGRPRAQLGRQMTPLVEQLPAGLRNTPLESPARNLGGVETVAAIHGLLREAR